MGLYLHEKHTEIVSDGYVLAIRQNGHVEVWDADGETSIGVLPEDATEGDVLRAFAFYTNGIRAGEKYGAERTRQAMRAALGL